MSKRTIIPLGCSLGLMLLASGLVHSALGAGSEYDNVIDLIQKATDAFRETTDHDVTLAKVESAGRLAALGTVLDAAGANGKDWKEYLRWDRLTAALASDATADVAELEQLIEPFTRDYSGLELPAIMRLRTSLWRYYHRRLALNNDQIHAAFDRRLERLGELVELMRVTADGATLQEAALQLSWFARYEQIPAVVAAARELAPEANVRLSVSQSFISRFTREAVDRKDPLTDCILGTTIRGTSHLVGTMMLFPVCVEHGARLEARLHGAARTTGRGYHGPVRANLVGVADVQATGTIEFSKDGFRVGNVRADVAATGKPTSIWTTYHSRIADGVIAAAARRRAVRTQPQADGIASRHAQQRLEQQLSEELQTRVGEMQRGFVTRFRNPLIRHETFPRVFRPASDAREARVDMLLANRTQTGAPCPPPATSKQAALHAQIHETALNNMSANLLAGRAISEAELRAFLGQLFSPQVEPTPVDSRESLQIVFANERPLTVQIDDSVVVVTLRADRFIKNRSKYPAMNMTLRYRVTRTAHGVLASRTGDPEVVPRDFESTGRRRLGAREIAARRLITRMLERDLAETYKVNTFTLPKPVDVFGPLAVSSLSADNGWIDVGVDPVE